MTSIILALAPVFLIIMLGYVVRRQGFVPDAFWPPAEKMTYYVFFPALIAANTAEATFAGLPVLAMTAAVLGGTAAVAGLAVALRPLLKLDAPAFTSFFQGSFRPNTYVGIAAAYAIYGERGLTLVTVALVSVVPFVNTLSVLALIHYLKKDHSGLASRLFEVIRNPILLGIALGTALNLSNIGLPPVAGPVIKALGQAALPLGLLAVGAGLDIKTARAEQNTVGVSAFLKLGVLPFITWGLCVFFGIGPEETIILVLYAALPCSAASYVLARQMGGDGPLLAGIITITTLLSMLAMPLWVLGLS